MVRIELKAFRLLLPAFTDLLVVRQSLESFETLGKVIGREELSEMLLELVVRLIVIALDGCLLDSAIHPLDLPVRPRMLDFGQPMFDSIFFTNAVEQMFESPFILQAIGKLDALSVRIV